MPVSEPITYPPPVLDYPEQTADWPIPDFTIPPRDKWEREYRAFWRMLPQLLATHRGKCVAIHEEQLVDSDDDPLTLAARVWARSGYVPICVTRVTERRPIVRIPSFRILSEQ
jgi:hypothetical protein